MLCSLMPIILFYPFEYVLILNKYWRKSYTWAFINIVFVVVEFLASKVYFLAYHRYLRCGLYSGTSPQIQSLRISASIVNLYILFANIPDRSVSRIKEPLVNTHKILIKPELLSPIVRSIRVRIPKTINPTTIKYSISINPNFIITF